MVRYEVPNVNRDMSFLEMLDVLNESLIAKGEDPVAFDHDCREGICGIVRVHGQRRGARTACRGTTRVPAPHAAFQGRRRTVSGAMARASAFPVVKDLMVDRSAFDRIIAAGGYISVSTGSAPDGNAMLMPKEKRRTRHGCRGMHRLRRVRGDVSERVGVAVHGRQDRAPRPCCRKASRNGSQRASSMVAPDAPGRIR